MPPYTEAIAALNADLVALEAKLVELRSAHTDPKYTGIMDDMKAAIDSLQSCMNRLDVARNDPAS